jgi:hypothetical protein
MLHNMVEMQRMLSQSYSSAILMDWWLIENNLNSSQQDTAKPAKVCVRGTFVNYFCLFHMNLFGLAKQ